MTVTTYIAVVEPIPPVRVLDELTRLAGGDPATVERFTMEFEDYHVLRNVADQDLDALVWVRYSPDGPLRVSDPDDQPPACSSMAAVDRPDADVVHFEIVAGLGEWLTEQGASWLWRCDHAEGGWQPPDALVGAVAGRPTD